MNNHVARLMVQAFACNARIAGMQATNQNRVSREESPAYDEADFSYEAVVLEGIAQAIADVAAYN